jgi:heme exporter protein A
VADVSKTFGRQRALARVTLDFAPGEIAAVLGPNGAGKTTLLSLLSTFSRPTTGQILLGEEPLKRDTDARRHIGFVGHEPGVYGDLDARQNLRIFAALYGLADPENAISAMLERVDLADVRADLPVRAYSRGMQQRLSLARALLPKPTILLFDEPASALDPAGAHWLSQELLIERDAGRLVVLVTHDLAAAAQVASHVVVLRQGRVALDRISASVVSEPEMRELYREALHAS